MKMIENSEMVKKVRRIGPIEEMEPLVGNLIGNVCTDIYHKVDKRKPVTVLVNGVRIIMYIEDENFAVRPPLGEMIRLHQVYEGNDVCIYCGKPVDEWETMEKCPARYEN